MVDDKLRGRPSDFDQKQSCLRETSSFDPTKHRRGASSHEESIDDFTSVQSKSFFVNENDEDCRETVASLHDRSAPVERGKQVQLGRLRNELQNYSSFDKTAQLVVDHSVKQREASEHRRRTPEKINDDFRLGRTDH